MKILWVLWVASVLAMDEETKVNSVDLTNTTNSVVSTNSTNSVDSTNSTISDETTDSEEITNKDEEPLFNGLVDFFVNLTNKMVGSTNSTNSVDSTNSTNSVVSTNSTISDETTDSEEITNEDEESFFTGLVNFFGKLTENVDEDKETSEQATTAAPLNEATTEKLEKTTTDKTEVDRVDKSPTTSITQKALWWLKRTALAAVITYLLVFVFAINNIMGFFGLDFFGFSPQIHLDLASNFQQRSSPWTAEPILNSISKSHEKYQ